MDSDNSGSIQSSSSGGDDQEYDSRAAAAAAESSISALFNSPGAVGAFDNAPLLQLYSLNTRSNSYLNNQQQQLEQQQHDQQQVMGSFHSLEGNNSNNLMANQNHADNYNNMNNHSSNQDMVWAHKFDMNPSCTQPGPVGYPISNQTTTNLSTPPQASLLLHGSGSAPSVPTNQDHQHPTPVGPGPGPGPGPIRNPKKRSRASRRAPTTVLTTDTTNFRQMVQEFTGIPAPPFSASGFPTSRSTRLDLDLFGGVGMGLGMGLGMGMGKGMGMGLGLLSRGNCTTSSSSIDVTSSSSPPGVAQQHPRYLLRPFPQKILPHQHPIPQQHKLNSITTPTTTTTITDATTNSTASLLDATVNPNSILPFQPLLQTPSSSSPLLPLIHHDSGQVNIGSRTGLSSSPMDQFGLARTTTTNATMQILEGGRFGPGSGPNPQGSSPNSVNANDQNTSNWVTHDQLQQQGFDQSQDGGDGISLQRSSAMNATLDDRGGGVRSEGMVDSWICSSD